MKQPFVLSLAFLLLFPCWLSAQDVTEQAAQAPDASLTSTEVLPQANIPTPTEISQAVETPSITDKYAITSYEPATASPTDSLQASGNAATVNDTTMQNPNSIAVTDTTQTKPDTVATVDTTQTKPDSVATADSTQAKPDTAATADTTQTKPDTVATADTTQTKPDTVSTVDSTQTKPVLKEEKATEKKPAQDKPKRFWGGITVGITYNDFYSTKFGLDDINHGKDISLSVSGADDLLNSYWGVGFKFGFGFMFMPNAYFNLRSDLTLALRQGTGKANASVILSKKEAEQKEKSDLKIEYSTSQLNIDWPILARVSIPKGIYFDAGPTFSFNVYAKNKVTIKDYYGSKTFEEKGGLKAFEFDIATGLGVMRHIGKSILDVDLRFIFGMTRISDANDAPKTWQGQLNITYWFL